MFPSPCGVKKLKPVVCGDVGVTRSFPSPCGVKKLKPSHTATIDAAKARVSVPLQGKKIETQCYKGLKLVTWSVSVPLRGKKIETCKANPKSAQCKRFRPLAG